MKTKEAKTRNRGVTLIALVVTIIVLLILAGVTISALSGDNGILQNAGKAKEETEQAEKEEIKKLNMLEAATNFQNKEYKDGKGNIATIPAGFAVSQVSGENIIDEGLVIIDSKGNEFVWIPVNNINEMAMCINSSDDSTCDLVIENNELVCKTHDSKEICGKLYATISGENFDANRPNLVYKENEGKREPDLLNVNDNEDKEYLSDIGYDTDSFMKEIKSEYIEMIKSVKKYKGFYVGRYETSNDGENVASKKNCKSLNAENASMWYGLYAKQKTYQTDSVQGGMIWGSQYDAMMRWMDDDTTATTDINTPDLTSGTRNLTTITGSNEDDKIKNVYDLYGSVHEWTLEADGTGGRVLRGGYFDSAYSPSVRGNSYPDNKTINIGSRITLYIK